MNNKQSQSVQRGRKKASPSTARTNDTRGKVGTMVTRATASNTRSKRQRKPSRILLESLESEAATQLYSPKDGTVYHTHDKTVLDKPNKTKRKHKPLVDRSDIDIESMHCCLCNVPIDYSDKDLLLSNNKDAQPKSEEGTTMEQQLLNPHELYDPQNAILICDFPGCNRAYHQRCHFVPVLSIPKGHWYCLVCKFKSEYCEKQAIPKKQCKEESSILEKSQLDSLRVPLSTKDLDGLYPPKSSQVQEEADPLTCLRFEFQSAPIKAQLLHQELSSRFKSTIHLQLMHIRRAKDTIRTYTTLKSVRKTLTDDYFKFGTLPQEFIQSVLLMARSKMKIRELFQSLEKLVHNWDDRQLNNSPNTCSLIQHQRRREPRFDIKDYDADEDDNEEEDTIEPTEKIKCCVCFSGHVGEDENDVLMCDGKDCMKAFHMKCIIPHITQQALDDDKNGTWFCPFCIAFATFIHHCRMEYMGDESNDPLKLKNTEDDSSDNMSDSSWDDAADVFSEAPFELTAAETWMSKGRTAESDQYLSSLHIPVYSSSSSANENTVGATSHRSVHATSGIRGNRLKDSTKNLSNDTCDSVHSIHEDAALETINVSNIIEGKRSRAQVDYKRLNESLSEIDSDDESEDQGDSVDVSNMIVGKRTRPKVDYRRLNGNIFSED